MSVDAPKKIDWTTALYQRWWRRMAEIFGKPWTDSFGNQPSQAWIDEIATWSVDLAAAVLVHYRRAGVRFPPNLSEVGKLARELRPGIEPLPPPKKNVEANCTVRKFAKQLAHDEEWLARYRNAHGHCSMREAAMELLRSRGQTNLVPAQILAHARAEEAKALTRDATIDAARLKHDSDDELNPGGGVLGRPSSA